MHYALQKLKILPHEFLAMDRYERAFVVASIQVRVDAEAEDAKKLKQKSRSRK